MFLRSEGLVSTQPCRQRRDTATPEPDIVMVFRPDGIGPEAYARVVKVESWLVS